MKRVTRVPLMVLVLLAAGVFAGGILPGGPTASFAATKDKQAKEQAAASKAVDVNSADEKTIAALPGIGKKTAKEIVAGRPYKSLDDLKRVKGMSDAKLKGIAGKVSFGAAPSAPAAAAPAAAPQKAAPARKADTSTATSSKLAPGQRVNINTASKEELDRLPGIGPVKAQAIIDSRPYGNPEDIMKVKGIKQKEFDKIRDLITVR